MGEPTATQGGAEVPLRQLLRGNVGALALISLLNDFASEMIYPLLPLFLTGVLGAGPAFLGLIEGVAEATASSMKLVGGVVSDRIRRRKGLVGWGYGIASLVRPLVAVVSAPWQVLLIRFSDRVGKGIRTAPRDALIVESVPMERRGAAFGIHRAADHLGSVIGPLVAAGLLLAMPGRLRLVFGLALLPGLVSLLVWWRAVTETGMRPGASRRSPGVDAALVEDEGAAAALGASEGRPTGVPSGPSASEPSSVLTRSFLVYLGVVVLFTLGNASDAFLLLRAGDLGVSAPAIPLLWGLLHLSKTVWSVPGGVIADRLGAKPVIALGWLVYALVYAGFALADSALHVWLLFGAYGLFFGLTESPEKALVARFAPAAGRARAFGIYHAAVGFAALPASLLFGVVWEWRGSAAAFWMGGGLALAAAVLLTVTVREGGSGR